MECQNEILGLMARGSDLSEILHALVGSLERLVEPALCSITVLDREGRRMKLACGPDFPAALVQALDAAALPEDVDMWAVEDVRESALAAGFRACLYHSIVSQSGGVLGAFNLFYPAPHAARDNDRQLLSMLSPAAAIAIELDHRAQALRVADERLTSLAASVPGVVYQRRVAPDGDIHYTYISEGVRDLFGVSAQEVLADPTALFDRHDPSYAANFRKRLLAASQSMEMWDVEASIISRDGQQKYTHAIARPYRQPDGSVLWNGLILDQTRIKKAELAAAEAAERTRVTIVESLSQGLVLFDSNDRLTILNSAFMKLYPQLQDIAVVGAGYEQVIAAELECEAAAGQPVEERLRNRLEQHKLRHHTNERQLADGEWILVSERRTSDGGTIILHSNITKLKVREVERTRLQEQFHRAQKMDAMGRLAGGIAHDFNNILGSILGNAGFLVEDLPPEAETAGFAKEIVIAAQRAKHLVQQILAFSRKANTEKEDVRVEDVVAEAVQLLRATMPKTIALEVHNDSCHANVRGNATELVQVLMNLCVNARDAIGSQHGSIDLDLDVIQAGSRLESAGAQAASPGQAVSAPDGSSSISTGQLRPDAPYLLIRVRDSGCGMEALVLGNMFEPFFTTKEVGKGTGLGLAAVHGIVSSHGGVIACTSRPGHGTTFEVFLPATEEDAHVAEQTPRDARPSGSESILVIDDEQQFSAALAQTLIRLGYHVDCFASPREALDAFQSTPDKWAMAITDELMPDMTGYELAERMLARQPNLPLILCSGATDTQSTEKARAAGIKACIVKPLDSTDIARTVRDLLDRRAA
jgi:signal transduction histidine kinase/ActR/RegA family two-component response regulator